MLSEVKKLNVWLYPELRKYLGSVNRRHGVVKTLALPNLRDLPPLSIDKLFVQPELSKYLDGTVSDEERFLSKNTLTGALIESRSLVLLGDPGSGKTTLIDWLAWRLSAGIQKSLADDLDGVLPIPCVLRDMHSKVFSSDLSIESLALLIAQRLLGEQFTHELKSRIVEFIAANRFLLLLDGVDEIPLANRYVVAKWMRVASEAGAYVVATSRIVGYDDFPIHEVLDYSKLVNFGWGKIDPILSKIDYNEIIKNSLSNEKQSYYAKNAWDFEDIVERRVISMKSVKKMESYWREGKYFRSLSSHLIKEGGDEQGKSWATLRYIVPFDQRRIELFIESWYLLRSTSGEEAKEKAQDLLMTLASSSSILELARTPSLCNLIAIVHRERAHLPDGRALLYKEIANAYLNTIDQYRQIEVGGVFAAFDWAVRESWLSYVGFRMQLERSGETNSEGVGVLVDEGKVLQWLAEAIKASGLDDPMSSAKKYLDWVARRSGLLIPKGDAIYSFVHLSFQEYFCARYLIAKIKSPKFVQNKLDQKSQISRKSLSSWASDPIWKECMIYALELASAEGDSDWGEYVAQLLFGDLKAPLFDADLCELAISILGNRHILLDAKWRRKLATCCLDMMTEKVQAGLYELGYLKVFPSNIEDGLIPFQIDFEQHKTVQKTNYEDIVMLIIGQSTDMSEICSAKFSNVRKAIVHNSDVSSLKFLGDCKNIHSINIKSEGVVDIDFIGNCKNLISFQLSKSSVTRVSDNLKLKKLKYFAIRNSMLENVDGIRDLVGLMHLDLSFNYLNDISSVQLLKNLITLEVCGNPLENIASVSDLQKLIHLDLSGTRVTDISPVVGLKSLRRLLLQNTPVEDVSALKGLSGLTLLNLENTKISDFSFFEGLRALMRLNLTGVNCSDIGGLKKSSNLRSIYLSGTDLEDVSSLSQCSVLSEINLSDTKVKDISCFSKLKHLKVLDLSNTLVTDISSLSELPNLRYLSIKGLDVGDISGFENVKVIV